MVAKPLEEPMIESFKANLKAVRVFVWIPVIPLQVVMIYAHEKRMMRR